MFNLVRYFSATMALALASVALILGYYLENRGTSELIDHIERQNVVLANSISNTLWPEFSTHITEFKWKNEEELRTHPNTIKLDKSIKTITARLGTIKVRIFNNSGYVVYSTSVEEFGADKSKSAGLKAVTRTKSPLSNLSFRDSFNANEGIVSDINLVETYIPIYSQNNELRPDDKYGKAEGVLELYSDVTAFVDEIRTRTIETLSVVIISFVLLYVALLLIILRGDRLIKNIERARQAATDELIQLKKMESLGGLTAGIAHNLNNLLHPIAALSERLETTLLPKSIECEYARRISKSAINASELVRQLTQFSRREVQAKSELSVHKLIEDTTNILSASMEKNVLLNTQIEEDIGEVLGNESQLQSVLINLANNSADALNGKNGEISILVSVIEASISKDEGLKKVAQVLVRDTGEGMDEETLSKIFEPFYTTKQIGKGTGLGLSTAVGIIEEHNGSLSCESTIGVGTTMRILLPLI